MENSQKTLQSLEFSEMFLECHAFLVKNIQIFLFCLNNSMEYEKSCPIPPHQNIHGTAKTFICI